MFIKKMFEKKKVVQVGNLSLPLYKCMLPTINYNK